MSKPSMHSIRRTVAVLCAWLAACCSALAQQASPPDEKTVISSTISAQDLVREACTNELAANDGHAPEHAFRSVKRYSNGSQTRLYVETQQSIAAMTIAYDDKPLTAQQMQGEEDHLNYLIRDADARRAKHTRELDDAERTRKILKAIPDAFLFEYDGTDTGTAEVARPGMRLTRLRFKPNPDYSPPSKIEQALTGMQGTLTVEPTQKRLALLDATLFRDVSFGWGFLGHLDKGGTLELRHIALDDGSWVLNRMRLKFTGKILIFKSLNVDSDEVLDQFHSVPADTTFAQAVEMLRSERDKLSASSSTKPPPVQ